MPHFNSRHTRGAALVAAFIAMVVFATMALALSMVSTSNTTVLSDSTARMKALMLAQAGMNMAASRIRNNVTSIMSMNDAVRATAPSGATAQTWVQNLTMSPNEFMRIDRSDVNIAGVGLAIRLTSWGVIQGQAGGRQTYTAADGSTIQNTTFRKIEAVLLVKTGEGSFIAGAFGDTGLVANGSIQTDSYDSRGVPVMKLNPAFVVGNGQPQYIADTGSVGPDGIAGSADDVQSKGPDGVLGTADDVLYPKFSYATYNQQVHISPRLKGPPERPNTTLDPVTAAELGSPNVAYTNAELDAFRTSTAGANGDVGTNGSISAVGALVIFGDATPGPGGTVTGGGTITGSTAPAPQPWALNQPIITIPTSGITGNSLPSGNSAVTLGVTGSNTTYVFSAMDSRDYTMQGHVTIYLTGDFINNGNDKITVSAGSDLTIYQTAGTFTMNGGGIVNAANMNPNDFTLVSTSSSTVRIAGNNTFYGTVYAPNAPVVLTGTAETYGALVGRSMDISGTSDFHYDVAATSPGIVQTISLVSYREMD